MTKLFDFSFAEFAIIFLVGLVVLGPEDLSKSIRYIKNIMRNVKNYSNDFINELTKEEEINDLKKEVSDINKEINTIVDLDGNEQITYDLKEVMQDIDNINKKP